MSSCADTISITFCYNIIDRNISTFNWTFSCFCFWYYEWGCNQSNMTNMICLQWFGLSNKALNQLSNSINAWVINLTGSEGYRTAEVTLGGIDTDEISSKTMMSKMHPGLFFIDEVVDVTGHLESYNFQWAWSSGYVAGQYA